MARSYIRALPLALGEIIPPAHFFEGTPGSDERRLAFSWIVAYATSVYVGIYFRELNVRFPFVKNGATAEEIRKRTREIMEHEVRVKFYADRLAFLFSLQGREWIKPHLIELVLRAPEALKDIHSLGLTTGPLNDQFIEIVHLLLRRIRTNRRRRGGEKKRGKGKKKKKQISYTEQKLSVHLCNDFLPRWLGYLPKEKHRPGSSYHALGIAPEISAYETKCKFCGRRDRSGPSFCSVCDHVSAFLDDIKQLRLCEQYKIDETKA